MLQALNLQVCQKKKYTTSIFQLICLPFEDTCYKKNFKEKSSNFEMHCIVCYSSFIALHVQLLQLVRLKWDSQPPKFLLLASVLAFEKWWKIHFISPKNLLLFSRYFNLCYQVLAM